MGQTVRIPVGFGKLVEGALSKSLVAKYDGQHGIAFVAKQPLFGICLSSYIALPFGTSEPDSLSITFMVGVFSYQKARRELLTWAAAQMGAGAFLDRHRFAQESRVKFPSPLTEMLPEIMVALDYETDAARYIEIPYTIAW